MLRTPVAATVIAVLSLSARVAAEPGIAFWVCAKGNDANAGTRDAPFGTLERARDACREQRAAGMTGSVVVTIRGGVYRVRQPLVLGPDDSGTPEAKVVWQGAPGEAVRLVGGARLETFVPVTDPGVRERLPAAARDHVVMADLRAAGIGDLGTVRPGTQRAELFFNQRYQTLARYPNAGWVRIAGIPAGAAERRPVSDPLRPDLHRYEGPFLYSDDRPQAWTKARDIWVHGYWYHDWRDEYHAVDRLDVDRRELWPKPPYHSYGYKKNQRYYYLNILEELDAPGEWYLDREAGLLYLWPPAPLASADVIFPELPEPMLVLEDARHVLWRGIVFEGSRAGAVLVRGGSDTVIAGCTVRNVGGTGIRIEGGARHTVWSCDVHEVGGTGISLDGGDRRTLSRGDHVVDNCHIHHFARVQTTYQPAIQINGVGNRIAHCFIHDGPHMGIGYSGNDHVIEFTECTRVARETGDVGAIYAAMDWSYAGHLFRYNYFHDIHGPGQLGCFTIYPDLPCGGIHLYGNVIENTDQVFHTNSGRGMLIENNLLIRNRRGINFSAWGDPRKFQIGGNWRMVERLHDIAYDRPPYSTRYPMLARLAEDFAKGDDALGERALPKDNIVQRNISWGESWFVRLRPGQVGLQHVQVLDNLICDPVAFDGSPTGDGASASYGVDDPASRDLLGRFGNVLQSGDPGFADAAAGDFRLRRGSPARRLGFDPIPFAKIGLRQDQLRLVLPAATPRIVTPPQLYFDRLDVRIALPPRGPRAVVRYTLDGSEPTAASPVYRRPIRITDSLVVTAAAWPVDGGDAFRSPTVSAAYRVARLGDGAGVFLSDLAEMDYVGYHAALMKDQAHGGAPIRLGGVSYAKGIITHPGKMADGNRSQAEYALDGPLRKARRFTARIGIEDQAPKDHPGYGTCSFAVDLLRGGRWHRVFASPIVRAGDAPLDLCIEIGGATRLRLLAEDGGDGISWDHAVWADAMVQ